MIFKSAYLYKSYTEMYFRVSNNRYQVQATTGTRRSSIPLPLFATAPNKMPPNFQSTGFAPPGGKKTLRGRAKVLKAASQKIPSTHSLIEEKSSHRLQICPQKPLLCPSVNKGEKKGKR